MNEFFRRQLAEYADYHQDWRNCLTHVIGNPILFLAAVLPLSLVPVDVLGVHISAAPLLVLPALLFWIMLDAAIGLAIAAAAIPLLFAAAVIDQHVSVVTVVALTVVLTIGGWVLQIVGHLKFEGRRPALLDNPIHMLISPMFMFAQLFIALGFRRDLAVALER